MYIKLISLITDNQTLRKIEVFIKVKVLLNSPCLLDKTLHHHISLLQINHNSMR